LEWCAKWSRNTHNFFAKRPAVLSVVHKRKYHEKTYDFSKARRGAVVAVPKGKSRITIRLDDAIIDWFRTQVEEAGGGNYQSLINAALRQHIGRLDEPLEKTLRRVLREELRKAS
jgi:uncharacterized protein (DUF4415 family)